MRSAMRLAPVVLIAYLAHGDPVKADDWGSCCGDSIRWFSNPTAKFIPLSFPAGSAQRDLAEQQFGAYSGMIGSWLQWGTTEDNDNSYSGAGDGSEIVFLNYAPDTFLLAVTDVYWGVCGWPACDEEITETDVEFFAHRSDGTPIIWDFNEPKGSYYMRPGIGDGGAVQDPGAAPTYPTFFEVVASHEFGHASGLAHTAAALPNGGTTRMSPLYPFGGWFHDGARVVPLPYDRKEIRRLYYLPATDWTVFSSSWHNRTTSNNTYPVTTASTIGIDDQRYPYNKSTSRAPSTDDRTVFPGDTASIYVCFGNLGNATTSSLTIEYFLSSNILITTSDAKSSTVHSITLAPNQTYCSDRDFVVPNAPRNEWRYVGVWINRGSATEGTSDNVTLIQRRLFVGNY